jgi:RecG-like helicase/DNA polymerase III epsilon subunit-like protein
VDTPIVIAFDLETTGLSKEKNRIIEIAAVNVTDPTHAPMSTLINPGRFSIPHAITQLTGITNSMVSAPAVPSFARAAELLETYVTEARRKGGGASVILAAHNARQFDAGFLQAEYRRVGRELPDDWRFLDTLPLARKRLDKNRVGSFKLETLAAHFECGPGEGEVAHRAWADARMLGDILQGVLGVSLEGTAGPGATDVVRKRGDTEKLREAVEAMASHSFSLGDPSKNALRRKTAATAASGDFSNARSSSSSSSKHACDSSFGATPIVTSARGEIDVLGSGGIAASELDDLSRDEDEDEDAVSEPAFSFSVKEPSKEKPKRKPFWIAADPIDGFVPETMDFARMTEASDSKIAASRGSSDRLDNPTKSNGGKKNDGANVDPALVELHARLRRDHSAWAEIPVDVLKEFGVPARITDALKKADVMTVERVLRCYPRKYQEFARYHPTMQNGTAVLVVGTVASFLKAPPSRKGWGSKTPATLLIDVRVDGEFGGASSALETFEMKIWEYIPVDVERRLSLGASVCARGILSGKTQRGYATLEKPTLAMHVDPEASVEVVPTYPKKHDVAPEKWPDIQRAAVEALKARLPADPMLVSLGMESTVLPELNLMSHVDAMKHIHRPDSVERVCDARERLAFEELVLLQTSLLRERERAQNSGGEGVSVVSTALCDELRSVLDFSLTRGQENAMEEIFHDMAGTKPMLRMLQGDVGCGKTIVAALAILAAVEAGHQGAFMAPTEVLAQQHAKTLDTLLGRLSNPPKVILLTGSMNKKSRDAALGDIENGTAQIIVGTHSLISDDVVFASLGIAVVDEQHRFGVEQRAALASKGPVGGYVKRGEGLADHAASLVAKENDAAAIERETTKSAPVRAHEEDGDAADAAAWVAAGSEPMTSEKTPLDGEDSIPSSKKKPPVSSEKKDPEPFGSFASSSDDDDDMVPWRHAPHMLAMSATPIPRTLAMCKHGEMALSSIDEKPAGRLPIQTKLLFDASRSAAYEAMTREVAAGGQCYIITPLVNTSTAESFERYKSAEEEFKRLEETYPNVKFGMVHGKMSGEEKNAALDAFASGRTRVLVATSVVEVGVDVPNASVIIIEDADRHGVSTLHQLRGRVGRGQRQSWCFLLVGKEAGHAAKDRLRVLEKTNNGFLVAESDLRSRGAGDLLGTRQSGGALDLFHASVQTDLYLLEAARRAAAETIARANVRGETLPAPLAIALRDATQIHDLHV